METKKLSKSLTDNQDESATLNDKQIDKIMSKLIANLENKLIWHFLMEETQRRGIGMIVVSHSPELVEKVCTRVVELK